MAASRIFQRFLHSLILVPCVYITICIDIMQFHIFMIVEKNVEFLSTFVPPTKYYNHRFISDISRYLIFHDILFLHTTFSAFSTFSHFYNSHKCISIRDLSVSLIYCRRGISFRLFLRENR